MAPPLVLVAAIFFGWFLFADLLIEAVDPVQAAHAERLEALRPKAEAGGAGAQFQIDIIYRDGLAGTGSPSTATKWLGRAAVQGQRTAQLAYERLYAVRSGVRQDYGRAAQFIAPPPSGAPTPKRKACSAPCIRRAGGSTSMLVTPSSGSRSPPAIGKKAIGYRGDIDPESEPEKNCCPHQSAATKKGRTAVSRNGAKTAQAISAKAMT